MEIERLRGEKLRLKSKMENTLSSLRRLEDTLKHQERESSKLKELIERERETSESEMEKSKQRQKEFEQERVALREMVSALREASEREAEERQERVKELEDRVAELKRELATTPVPVEKKKEEPVVIQKVVEERKIVMSDRQTEEREMALERKIQRLERTRKSLSEELVNKEEKEREMSEKLKRADRIVQNYKKLRVKHKVLLELLGEREEELDRLRK